MKFGAAQFVLLLAGLACRAAAEVSGWDELQLRLLEDRATPVRWFNVGRSQFISGGDTVRAQWGWAPDYVELAPGQEAVVSVPGAAWLRLVGRSAHFAPGDISLSVSTDGRAFTDAVLIGTTDSRSWLVALPRADCVVIRLAHRADATAPVAFELYFSQVWPLDTILPYRDAVPLAGNSRLIRDRFEPIFQRAWLVEPGRAAELTVSGPTRLQLIARTDWGAAGAVANRLVVVQLQLDDGPVAPLVLVPELEDEVGLNLLRSLGPVSKRMVAFVSVPAGTHRLRVTPSVPTYISVFRQEERPFLVPALNAPRAGAMESAQFGPPPAVGDVLAQLTADPGRYPAGELAAFEQAAWWFAIANQFRDAAGQAADSAARISRGRWDYPPAHRTAARLRQRGTFYRELLPMSDSGSIALEHACFAPERMRAARAATEFVTVVSPTLEHARELLADAHFVPVPDSASEPLIYAVPARAFESDLRLAALVPGYGHAEFYVQLDDAPPVRVAVRDRTRTDTLEVAMPRAFAVLGVMAREARCSTGVELQPAFGEFDLPLRIEPAAVAELALPARTRVVRLYREPSAPEVKVSVAYRAARTFALSESDYLALLDQLGPAVAFGMLTNFGTLPDEFGPARVLASHLVPLWRLVRAHSADFSKGIEPVPGSDEAVRGLAPAEVREVESAARAFEAAGRYVEAIGCWSRLFWTCGREGRAVAALEIMRLLQLVGEEHLAAQYARFALCSSAPDRLPARAIEFLADAAAAHDDPDQLERLRAFVFTRCPCNRHLRELVLALAANSRHQLVLSAGLLLPPAERPLEPMLIAALHLNWWCTYDRLLESLATEQEKCFWRAHKALAFGRFDSAEQYLAQAGYIGTNSLAALRAGLRIRARLAARSMADRLAALLEWEQWQLAHPGPRVWSEAAELVSECAGGELLYNCELDSYVRCYRADPTAPVCIRFLGPARLRVEARPLVPAPCEAPLDDWLEVWEHCMTNRVAMSQVVANPALQPVNKTNAVAGQRSTATFDFGPGFHEVQVRARTNSVLVRVFREVPALPLRVLPVLTPWRAEEVLGGVWAQMREARRLEL
ncbi:MAG: hypothetical protein NZ739_02950, partial [Verrucomicrobiae bacterium]|nr:hypothetical protein [Verrucomicrobiae bacterium]